VCRQSSSDSITRFCTDKKAYSGCERGGRVIDVSCGRRTRAVVLTDSEHVILSAIQTETVANRLSDNADASYDDDIEEEEEA